MHTYYKHIIFSILFLTSCVSLYGQELPSSGKKIPVKTEAQQKTDSIINAEFRQLNAKELDSLVPDPEANLRQFQAVDTNKTTTADSLAADSIKNTSFLEYKIESQASDYKRIDRRANTITLYNKAQIVYGDIRISAGKIIIDNNTGNIFAYGIVEDSTGVYTQKPEFTQGTNTVKPDSIIFNKDTKKALTFNSVTKQGEFNVIAEVVKKVNDSVFFMRNARFTTSKDPEDPEYYFLARRIKMVPKKKIVTGLVNMYIADVPTPLGLPFAFFPMTTERKSGIILPSFGNNNSQGYFLQNGGYYFAVNDYFDLTVLGDYFTNGSYGARVESSYRKRYRYSGTLRFLYENQLRSERGFSDFSQSTRYNLNWQHTQDPKSNPNSRFSASVNLGSSEFFRQSFNQINQSATLNNTLASSIAYSKTFQGEPQVNLNTTVSVRQNVNQGTVNLTLPTIQGSVSRVFPFAKKNGTKKGIIQNINLQYNVRAENTINTNDDDFLTGRMFDDAVMGVSHSIPIATNFKVSHFSISASASYDENWVFETIDQTFVPNGQGGFEIKRDTINGFDSYRTYSYGANVGTQIFGNWKSNNPESKVQAIRHVVRPSISYSASPSFDQYYERLLDERGLEVTPEERLYSRFEGSYAGAPGRVFSSNIGINVQNNIEAKVRDKDTTVTDLKKIALLKTLTFSTNYNLAGDSLNWSPLQVRGVIPLTKKIDLNLDANFDPYALNNENQRTDTFNVNNGGSLLRLTRAGARVSFSLSDKDFNSDLADEDRNSTKLNDRTLQNGGREDDLFGQAIDPNATLNTEPEQENVDISEQRYRFKIPWSLNFAYTMTYNNAQRQDEINNQSLMVSGDIELSPRWSVGGNTGYDFVRKGVTFTTLRFQRDLESFRMSFNWTPIGPRNSWFFFIGIKASALSDIKWDQRKQPDPQF